MLTREEFVNAAQAYMDTVYRVAYSWLKNSDDANDVTQEVLIKLFKEPQDFASDAHLKNWLIRVTINQCKMIFRSPWSRMENIEEYAETLEFEQQNYRDLFDAVMQLDRKYRIPLMLFYYEGYSTAETASILKLPVNTVSTRLARAKEKLRENLKEEQ